MKSGGPNTHALALIDRKIQQGEHEMQEMRLAFQRLEDQLAFLRQLKSELSTSTASVATEANTLEDLSGRDGFAAMGPKEAVLALLRKEPGLKASEVAKRLALRIRTSAADPKRTLLSTIYNLLAEGALERRAGRRLVVVEMK